MRFGTGLLHYAKRWATVSLASCASFCIVSHIIQEALDHAKKAATAMKGKDLRALSFLQSTIICNRAAAYLVCAMVSLPDRASTINNPSMHIHVQCMCILATLYSNKHNE